MSIRRPFLSPQQWIRSINSRFKKLKKEIRDYLSGVVIVTNVNEVPKDPVAIGEFLLWLEAKIDEIIFSGMELGKPWSQIYIDRAYLRGVKLARAELKRQGVKDILAFTEDLQPALIEGTATPFLGAFATSSVLNQPIHLDAIQLLYTRSFTELKGITQAMSQQIARTLVDGLEQGDSLIDTAKLIDDRVEKIGLSRARMVARTETIRALNQGVLNEGKDMAERLDLDIKYRWFTALDERVRSTHKTRHDQVYTYEEAMSLIGEPNCRCTLLLIIVEKDN